MAQSQAQQVPVGTVLTQEINPLRFIASQDYGSASAFWKFIVPAEFIDTVASQLFFKLMQSGITITLPSRDQVHHWMLSVGDTGHGQLVMDCVFHFEGDSEENPNRLYGGAVLTYSRVTEDGKLPAGYDCQLSFHT